MGQTGRQVHALVNWRIPSTSPEQAQRRSMDTAPSAGYRPSARRALGRDRQSRRGDRRARHRRDICTARRLARPWHTAPLCTNRPMTGHENLGPDPVADCHRAGRTPGAGEERRRAARRRGQRALHRALPQGGHRRPGRQPAARAGSAPGLPARAAGAARRGAEEHRRAGQADARAARGHRRRRHQAGAGGPVPALQAQAPQQGADRARGRHRAAGRQAVCRPGAGPGGRGRGLRQCRGRLRRRAGGAGRRARHPVRALGRGRRAGGPAARLAVGRRPAARAADAGQG